MRGFLLNLREWNAEVLEKSVRDYVEINEPQGLKLREIAQPLRAALAGSTVSPPIFEVMEVLGREEALARMGQVLDD